MSSSFFCRITAASMIIRPAVFSSVCVLCRVRLIGVDTSETKHPCQAVPPVGEDANAFNKRLVEGMAGRVGDAMAETNLYDVLSAVGQVATKGSPISSVRVSSRVAFRK
jgi:endonuclease YncB( thermonuclease family)